MAAVAGVGAGFLDVLADASSLARWIHGSTLASAALLQRANAEEERRHRVRVGMKKPLLASAAAVIRQLKGPKDRQNNHHYDEADGNHKRTHFDIIAEVIITRAHHQRVDRRGDRRSECH